MAEQQPTTEQWRPVVGYEGLYEVSDHGRVYSAPRTVVTTRGSRKLPGRILAGSKLVSGHRTVFLTIPLSGSTKTVLVHRLVLEAFVGPCPDGQECCHWDDDPTNNRLENLRWATRSENMRDRTRNGRHNNGTKGATHCKRGHLFDAQNTVVNAKGYRGCRTCRNAADRRRESEKRAANPKPDRTHCGRGHLLEEPNLRKSVLPKKSCLSCHRGHAWATHNGKLDDLQAVTDRYYENLT